MIDYTDQKYRNLVLLVTNKNMPLLAKLTIPAALLSLLVFLPWLPLHSNRTVEAPFLDSSGSRQAIVFFGFRHCQDVCPTTLGILRELVLSGSDSAPDVIFVDIDSNSDAENAQRFARHFHPTFKGYHAEGQTLQRLSQDFGLNISQDGEQISHRGRTYLLERKNQQWYVTTTFNPGTFNTAALSAYLL